MDVDDAAAGEYLVELVALQLVIARATAHHHGFDVEVVQRVGHPVEQHPVVGDDFFRLVRLATAALRVAAAQIAWRQHGLHARVPEHGLGGQTNLAEQALGTAPGEIKHCLGLGGGGLRVADDGHVIRVFDVQQGAGGLFGQTAGHFFVDEVDDLLFDGRCPHRGRRLGRLRFGKNPQHIVGQALRLEAHAHHGRAGNLDGFGVGGVQKEHGRRIAGAETLLPHLAQQIAHIHRDVAKVDLDRAWRLALVAHGAVVCYVLKLLPVADADAPAGLLFVQKGLNQKRGSQNFVARAVEQIRARHMGRAHRLAFAAAQAVFDGVGNRPDIALLHDDGLVSHQAKRRRVGVGQI